MQTQIVIYAQVDLSVAIVILACHLLTHFARVGYLACFLTHTQAGRKPLHRMSGTIKVNGRAISSQRMLDVSGYVPQHDVLPGTLTVKEHLLFHAKLRCPPGKGPGASAAADDAARRSRVADVIEALGLSKCADTRIGGEFTRGLSGGEKRRVSVAEELVVEPGILFLDEPTTGLDSSTVRHVVLCGKRR